MITVFAYALGAIAVVAAAYVSMGRDLLRITIAFFLELAAVGGILLTLSADYLAFVVIMIGLLGTALIASFSSGIMGNLKESLRHEASQGSRKWVRVSGMGLGLAAGCAIGWAFVSGPLAETTRSSVASPTPMNDVTRLGRLMLSEHVVAFELLSVLLLIVVIGAAFLLRDAGDAR